MVRKLVLFLCMLLGAAGPSGSSIGWSDDEDANILRRENRVAWCIVPFDAKKRGPAERALMLSELGIDRCAYDWRDEHVPTFEQEILEYKKHGIDFFAFWSTHDDAFALFEKYDLHPQIWQTLSDPSDVDDAQKVAVAAERLLPLAQRTSAMKCKLGLYNHGGWGGEPKNLVAVCERLHALGQHHVGIVYNFHHGHGHIDDWSESLTTMLPHLICVNLNGMNDNEQPKILGIGKGQHELGMIRTLVDSGYDGPIGILDHRDALDARESLLENHEGLDWVQAEIREPGSLGPKPSRFIPRVYPGAAAYRSPPITVEVNASIRSRDQFQILVASDPKQSSNHWELFTFAGTGHLTAYLPGKVPDHVRSQAMICDAKQHVLTMHYEPSRVRLYVDGQQVADQAIRDAVRGESIPGALGIGRLAEGVLGDDVSIRWVRLSQGIRDVVHDPSHEVRRDESTVGYWSFSPDANLNDSSSSGPSKSSTNDQPSLVTSPYDAERVQRLVALAQSGGDEIRGARLFADAKIACLSCHSVGALGGSVGPDLSIVSKDLTMNSIVESVLWPQREVKPEYMSWRVLTTDGSTFTGYKVKQSDHEVHLRDVNSAKVFRVDLDEIEDEVSSGSLMPDGLDRAMNEGQLFDLIRFLQELKTNGSSLSPQIHAAIAESHQRSKHSHEPVDDSFDRSPLDPSRWRHHQHPVNRDRVYDFYTKQAEAARRQGRSNLIAAFPGLDGGQQGHWGNQNEDVWRDDRWNQVQLGSVQSGVFRGNGATVARGICVRLGDHHELSACFNPDTLSYDVVWKDGFVTFSSVRHGFMDGMRMEGTPVANQSTRSIDQPRRYLGFYRSGPRVVFSYLIGDVHYLDSPWVRRGEFTREVAPAKKHSLGHVIHGGSPQWPTTIDTSITLGSEQPYAIDTIELPSNNPWNVPLFCTGHDFLSDGTALVATMHGDVWHVTGLDTSQATWRRFASGLHHPLGLLVSDDDIYVQCRDQLVRLNDVNDDGEADYYECVNQAFVTSPAGHDFIAGLQRDTKGNFYTVSGNQGLLRLSPDGKSADVVATGFRNPDGLGLSKDGSMTVPVSEGEWTPASAIHRVSIAVVPSNSQVPHFGYGGPRNNQLPELPLVYLPRGVDNSSGEQVEVMGDRFGPLGGQLLHLSFGTGNWFVILRSEIDGQCQGAAIPMTGDFQSGVHRGRFRSHDGQLYVSGMSGWGSYTPDDGCFQRVRYTGAPVQVPIGFHVHSNGIRVNFSQPLDPSLAGNESKQFAQCWNYRYGAGYGSPELSPSHPGVAGHDPLAIRSAHVLDDQRSLFLEIPDLQPVNVLHLRLHVNHEDSLTCSPAGSGHDLFVTVHQLDEPFEDFPSYQPTTKVIAAHPMTRDLQGTRPSPVNPWAEEIAGARRVSIATDKNLTFATRLFEVKANEPLALTLSNPDVVPHNLVIARAGTLHQVGVMCNQLVADPNAVAKQYVPETDSVLAYTDVVSPGEQQTIYIIAPPTPGRYPFLCTFPGHWMVMNGVMVVQ